MGKILAGKIVLCSSCFSTSLQPFGFNDTFISCCGVIAHYISLVGSSSFEKFLSFLLPPPPPPHTTPSAGSDTARVVTRLGFKMDRLSLSLSALALCAWGVPSFLMPRSVLSGILSIKGNWHVAGSVDGLAMTLCRFHGAGLLAMAVICVLAYNRGTWRKKHVTLVIRSSTFFFFFFFLRVLNYIYFCVLIKNNCGITEDTTLRRHLCAVVGGTWLTLLYALIGTALPWAAGSPAELTVQALAAVSGLLAMLCIFSPFFCGPNQSKHISHKSQPSKRKVA